MIDLDWLEGNLEGTNPEVDPTTFINLAKDYLPLLIEELRKTREERDHYKSETTAALMKIKKLEGFCDEIAGKSNSETETYL